jgi:hypothetical protein
MTVKYIGLDVHQATTVAAVLDDRGKLVMECILETKASTLLDFVGGTRHFGSGQLGCPGCRMCCSPMCIDWWSVTPRKNALLKQGNKSDKIDARKLAEFCGPSCFRRSTTARTGCAAARLGPQLSHAHRRYDAGDEPH